MASKLFAQRIYRGASHAALGSKFSSRLLSICIKPSHNGIRNINTANHRYAWKLSPLISKPFSSKIITENLESLGDSITSAVLVSWAKEPGDFVKEDDVITIVETDKVTMDIRAKKSGVFVEALAAAQSEIAVGSPLYKLDISVAELPPINAETIIKAEVPPPPVSPKADAVASPILSVDVPVMGESITTGVLAKWNVKVGDFVKVDEVVANIETDKVNVEVRSPQSGYLKEIFNAEGEEISVGNPLFVLSLSEGSPAPSKPVATAAQPVKPAAASLAPAPVVAPAVAKAAAEAVAAPKSAASKPASSPAPTPQKAAPTTPGDRSETRVKMTRMRIRIAQRLKEAQNTAAMLTTFQEVDMTQLIELRNKHKDDFEKAHGIKLGFMSAFVRAATACLQELPAVNGVIDDATNEIVYRNYVDISVAVASPNGLVVPVLRNTEKMGFADVEKVYLFSPTSFYT